MKIFSKLLFSLFCLSSLQSFADVSVIVNKSNSGEIDQVLIKRIYLGKAKSFPTGEKVDVLTLADDSSVTEEFRTKALKKSNSQFKSYWSKLVFTGKGTPPAQVADEKAMVEKVIANKNALGFVSSDSVTADVKVVATY